MLSALNEATCSGKYFLTWVKLEHWHILAEFAFKRGYHWPDGSSILKIDPLLLAQKQARQSDNYYNVKEATNIAYRNGCYILMTPDLEVFYSGLDKPAGEDKLTLLIEEIEQVKEHDSTK